MSISSTADSLHPPSPSSSLSSVTILSIVTLHNSKSNSHRHRSSFEARDCKKSLTGKDWGLLRFPLYKLQIKTRSLPPSFASHSPCLKTGRSWGPPRHQREIERRHSSPWHFPPFCRCTGVRACAVDPAGKANSGRPAHAQRSGTGKPVIETGTGHRKAIGGKQVKNKRTTACFKGI